MNPLTSTHRQLARIEAKLDALLKAAGTEIKLEEKMDATAEELQATLATLTADAAAENEAIVNVGNAVANAGTKFTELKGQIEGLQAGVPLTDEQIQALNAAAAAVHTANTEANGHLVEAANKLGEETAAA